MMNKKLLCKHCNKSLTNIEYSHSNYYSWVCVTLDCPMKGKVQVHGKWSDHESVPSDIKFPYEL